jgi:hypothetical protein
MKKPYRQSDGFYHVDGKKYKTLMGSREKVWNGTVHKTTGGLTRKDLVMNKWGRIVSANKYKTAKKEMRLQKHGFFAEKGKFGAVTRKVRGGILVKEGTPPPPKRENRKNVSDYKSDSESESKSDYEPKEENKGGASPKSSGKNNKSPTDKSKGNNKSPIEEKSSRTKPMPAWKPDRDVHHNPTQSHNSHMKEIIMSLKLKKAEPPAPPLKPNIKTDVSNYNKKDR